jgi:allophanate hydrolase subunit 1
MANKYFPDWDKANLVLDTFVDEHFGIYMSRPTEETAYITFLPEDKLAEVVPAEQAPKLNELARAFTTVMVFLLEKQDVLRDVLDSLTDKEKEHEVKTRFETFIKSYKAEKGDDVKDVLKHFLGCPVMLQEHY